MIFCVDCIIFENFFDDSGFSVIGVYVFFEFFSFNCRFRGFVLWGFGYAFWVLGYGYFLLGGGGEWALFC